MKFVINIECDSISEFEWLAARLRREGTATISTQEAPEFPDDQQRPNGEAHAAPADVLPARGRGRPKKEAPAKPAEAPAPALAPAATGTIPELKTLIDAITVSAREAMKNKEPGAHRRILDLLPAFREATGLDFVMNAKEEHRQALWELAQQAQVAIP
jgi:hypothetical protein